MRKQSMSIFYEFLIVIQCCIFGFSFVVLKKLISYDYPTFAIIGYRFLVGAVALLPICALAPKTTPLALNFNRKSAVCGFISGFTMLVAYSLQTYGAKYTSSANNALCTGLYVVFVPFIGMLITKKRNKYLLLAAFISFLGVSLVSGFSFDGMSFNIGDFLSVMCGFFFAIHFIIMERFTPHVNLSLYTIVQLITVSIISIFLSSITESNLYNSVQWADGISWIIFLGVFSTSITYMIQSIAQSKISANVVSVISCSESLFAVIFSLAFGYAKFSIELLIGSILILASMVFISLPFLSGISHHS